MDRRAIKARDGIETQAKSACRNAVAGAREKPSAQHTTSAWPNRINIQTPPLLLTGFVIEH